MHRLGFEENTIDELIATLGESAKSILSHLATSDDIQHYDFAKSQIELFERLSSDYKRIRD
jgi:alanine racemase